MSTFEKATKHQAKLRLALIGPSGSGKTYSALKIATGLGGKIAVIDTERGSASKYADQFNFDVCELETFSPDTYATTIAEAARSGYDILVIDSLSHAWMGKDGALEQVDKVSKRSQSGNSFAAWREVTPMHNRLVESMLQAGCHIIVTMRAKTEYVMEKDDKGKTVPRKVGLAPIQRDGLEYEFDVVADMTLDNDFVVSKSRCQSLTGVVISKPGEDVAKILHAWLTDGAPAVAKPQPAAPKNDLNAKLHAMAGEAFGKDKAGAEAYAEFKAAIFGENIKTPDLTPEQAAVLESRLRDVIDNRQAA